MTAARILLADDDASLRRVIEFNLQELGYQVDAVGAGAEALIRLREHEYDLVVTDIKMPDVDGLTVLDGVKRLQPRAPVILITAFASVEAAVEAMKRGAYDYVTKPFNRDEFKLIVARALRSSQLEDENQRLRGELEDQRRPEALIVGDSPAMRATLERVRKVAQSDATVLLTGESGTGKELIARALHFGSPRRTGPFVVVNCGAIPRDLLESELFGHVRGAFTGAVRDKQGKFEQASGGTLFLDEIGELPPELQVKLLRALQEREIERVGEGKPRRIDVRLVAATNRDLEAMIEQGDFREDLYYRINVIPIDLPPLRQRAEDVPVLVRHFLRRFAPDAGIEVAPEAMDALVHAHWRGNVRELMNACERLVTLRRGDRVELSDLPPQLAAMEERPPQIINLPADGASLDDLVRGVIVQALERCGWNQAQAARFLRIPRHILLYRMEKYAITPPREPAGG
ncbi:MAG TPA: sigma-54 dependent transcriptional regulator [Polyangia bacterium]|jgi:two-component system NtrC family response regulator